MPPNLLNRSNFSLLNSSLTIDDIVDFAEKNGHSHVVIAELGNNYSWVNFHRKARERNLIPVLGLQITLENSPLLILARNRRGYGVLLGLPNNPEIIRDNLEDLVVINLDGEILFPGHRHSFVANSGEGNGVYVRENKFKSPGDYELFCLLRAIANNSDIKSEMHLNGHLSDDHLQFRPDLPDDSIQIRNIYHILGLCEDYEILDSGDKLNFYPSRGLAQETLRFLAQEGLGALQFRDSEDRARYEDRLNWELEIVFGKNFEEYFLMVQDVISWARSQGIYVGPGRGSACGSLLSYCLGITEVDPLKYDLYFERFLNPNREDNPDIDVDIANNRRDQVIKYLRDKYGQNHVALINSFQTFRDKNSIRETCRAYGLPEDIPRDEVPDEVIRMANRLINFPRATSMHAAGVIISSRDLTEFIAVHTVDGMTISSWGADELKAFNLIKFDLLALQNLSILRDLEDGVYSRHGRRIIWPEVGDDDPGVYGVISRGDNSLVFQFDTPRSREFLRKFKPSSLLDLSLASALNRPGASRNAGKLLARKSSGKYVGHESYGLIIYQEQVIRIFSSLLGITFGEADLFRRGLSRDSLESTRAKFLSLGMARGHGEDYLLRVWGSLVNFSEYGFNKSHSIAYSLISYRFLYLKAHYPDIFYPKLLSIACTQDHLLEIYGANLRVRGPTVNYSLVEEFNCVGGCIYFPLRMISKLGTDFFMKIPPFLGKTHVDTLGAIRELIGLRIGRNDILVLIRVGFLNDLFRDGESEAFWEANLENIYHSCVFRHTGGGQIFDLTLTQSGDADPRTYESYRIECLGIDLDRPFIPPDVFRKYPQLSPISRIHDQGQSIQSYVCFISDIKKASTSTGTKFHWIKLSDSFFTSGLVAWFGPGIDEIRGAIDGKLAVNVRIERRGDFFKAVGLRILKRHGGE